MVTGPGQAKATKAVILARGLGKRMRAQESVPSLDSRQAAAADTGVKAMIPVGRPFLDYVLTAVADAGFQDVCLVVGPEHDAMRRYYEIESPPSRLGIAFVIQQQPFGTADAVLAAEEFAGDDLFAVLNSDNYYPAPSLAALAAAGGPAMVAFARSALAQAGDAPASDKLSRFGAVEVTDDGFLRRIVGDPETARASTGGEIHGSMNCWLFDRGMFQACREVGPSARGELELPQAVQHAIDHYGMRFKVILSREAVLDLSSRADIAAVASRLAGVPVRL